MDRATEIAHRIIPAAGSEWPLSKHGRAVLMSRAADIIRAELEAEGAAENEACAEVALAENSFMMLQDFGMQSMCTQVRENVARAIRARRSAKP